MSKSNMSTKRNMSTKNNSSTIQRHAFTEYDIMQINKMLNPESLEEEKPSHSVRLLKKRREVAKLQEDVKLQTQELQTSQLAHRRRMEKLKEKEGEMKRRIRTSKLLQSNEEQRRLAERKAMRCTEPMNQKQEYLQELNKELETLILQREQLRKESEENSIYAKYFDQELKESKRFQEPYELIAYCNTRSRIQQELLASIEEKKAELESSQADLNWVRRQYSFARVANQTEINTLRKQLENVEQEVRNVEEQLNDIKKSVQTMANQQASISLSTYTLSKYMWNTGSEITKPVKPEETTELLSKLQEFICDLKGIWERVNEAVAKKQSRQNEEQNGNSRFSLFKRILNRRR